MIRLPATAFLVHSKSILPSRYNAVKRAPLKYVVAEGILQHRSYRRGVHVNEAEAVSPVVGQPLSPDERRRIAADFNRRRAEYNREVSKLRKEYAQEIAAQKIADKASKEKRHSYVARSKLERQRVKNIRIAQKALIEEEKRKQQAVYFEKHLERAQIKREARKELYRSIRQMAIDTLEKDAHHWLSTPEEVEAAFSPEAEQKLWSRPHGVLGSPNPTPDAHFWQQLSHTANMRKTYKSQQEYLLDTLRDRIYDEANLDKKYWTPERLKEVQDVEDRARLRSDVQVVGTRELLKRQTQMIQMDYGTKSGELPKRKPPPSLSMLANKKALEAEGSKVLLDDPTKFFVFDDSSVVESKSESETGKYEGPSLGAPIGYQRIGQNEYTLILGKPKAPNKRTEKEKKQIERENRLLKAAGGTMGFGENAEFVSEEEYLERLPTIDYNTAEVEEDPEDREWIEGVDPHTEEGKAILDVQPALRMSRANVEWAREQLESQKSYYEGAIQTEMESYQSRTLSRLEYIRERALEENPDAELPDFEVDRILLSMPVPELMELSDIDEAFAANPMSDAQIAEAAEKLPSLSESQLKEILTRDRTFVPDEPPSY